MATVNGQTYNEVGIPDYALVPGNFNEVKVDAPIDYSRLDPNNIVYDAGTGQRIAGGQLKPGQSYYIDVGGYATANQQQSWTPLGGSSGGDVQSLVDFANANGIDTTGIEFSGVDVVTGTELIRLAHDTQVAAASLTLQQQQQDQNYALGQQGLALQEKGMAQDARLEMARIQAQQMASATQAAATQAAASTSAAAQIEAARIAAATSLKVARIQQETSVYLAGLDWQVQRANLGLQEANMRFQRDVANANLRYQEHALGLQAYGLKVDQQRIMADLQQAHDANKLTILDMMANRSGPQDQYQYQFLLSMLDSPTPGGGEQQLNVFDILGERPEIPRVNVPTQFKLPELEPIEVRETTLLPAQAPGFGGGGATAPQQQAPAPATRVPRMPGDITPYGPGGVGESQPSPVDPSYGAGASLYGNNPNQVAQPVPQGPPVPEAPAQATPWMGLSPFEGQFQVPGAATGGIFGLGGSMDRNSQRALSGSIGDMLGGIATRARANYTPLATNRPAAAPQAPAGPTIEQRFAQRQGGFGGFGGGFNRGGMTLEDVRARRAANPDPNAGNPTWLQGPALRRSQGVSMQNQAMNAANTASYAASMGPSLAMFQDLRPEGSPYGPPAGSGRGIPNADPQAYASAARQWATPPSFQDMLANGTLGAPPPPPQQPIGPVPTWPMPSAAAMAAPQPAQAQAQAEFYNPQQPPSMALPAGFTWRWDQAQGRWVDVPAQQPQYSTPVGGVAGGGQQYPYQTRVPMYAGGGNHTMSVFQAGERGRELIFNPTNAPLSVIPNPETEALLQGGNNLPAMSGGGTVPLPTDPYYTFRQYTPEQMAQLPFVQQLQGNAPPPPAFQGFGAPISNPSMGINNWPAAPNFQTLTRLNRSGQEMAQAGYEAAGQYYPDIIQRSQRASEGLAGPGWGPGGYG